MTDTHYHVVSALLAPKMGTDSLLIFSERAYRYMQRKPVEFLSHKSDVCQVIPTHLQLTVKQYGLGYNSVLNLFYRL